MQQSPWWQGFRFVLAQLTIGEMGTITAMSATISGAFFYVFKTAISMDLQRQMDERYVMKIVDQKDKELLEWELEQRKLEHDRLVVALQAAILKADAMERRMIAHGYWIEPGQK